MVCTMSLHLSDERGLLLDLAFAVFTSIIAGPTLRRLTSTNRSDRRRLPYACTAQYLPGPL